LIDVTAMNTKAVQDNTDELRDLRSNLINAPAQFMLPATATLGGNVPSNFGYEGSGRGGSSDAAGVPGVTVIIQGDVATSQKVGEIRSAVMEAVSESYRRERNRFAKRVTR
jgi:hypothetical protein